jgi:DNA polymerase III subunit delta
VVLDSLVIKDDKTRQERLLKILESMPCTTHLILIAPDHQKWRRDANGSWTKAWELLTPTNWLVKWFIANPSAEIIDLPLPDEKEMAAWITAEARRQGGSFEPVAAHELSMHVGNDTGIASQEIGKLLMYVDFQRPVNQKDVIEGVSVEGTTDVFTMLDELVTGKAQQAQSLMHRLLGDTPPEVVLGAVTHRFRQLIQVREALDAREDLKTLVNNKVIFANQVGKYSEAARRFPTQRLIAIYQRLLEIDVQAKTSQVDLETNLEMLVVEISN